MCCDQDVERIEARLRALEAELGELQQGAAEQAAIDGVVATMSSLRKQLQVEVAEAEQADAIAQAERREAEAAAAVAAAEQEEAAAAALAASKRPAKGKGKRRKGKGQLQVVRRPHLPTLPCASQLIGPSHDRSLCAVHCWALNRRAVAR